MPIPILYAILIERLMRCHGQKVSFRDFRSAVSHLGVCSEVSVRLIREMSEMGLISVDALKCRHAGGVIIKKRAYALALRRLGP